MQRKGLSSLYSEPYYPPGYCGYTPQFNFQFGETYGKTTSRLLQDKNVSKSRKSVLVKVISTEEHADRNRQTNETDCTPLIKLSWGDQKFTDKMVPGYTGYIPLRENKIGSRYALLCQQAIHSFRHKQQVARESKIQGLVTGQTPPLKQQRRDSAPYVSTHQVQHSISPYKMSENDPSKTFMAGYTGFIPRSRSRFATGYPELTMQALKDFTRDQQKMKLNATLQIDMSGTKLPAMQAGATNTRSQSIYVQNGLLPQYTGYLPGHKFRFGETYGTSARYFHSAKCSS